MDVGFSSLGTFSRVFRDIVGEPPSRLPAARAAAAGAVVLRDGLAATEQFRRSTGGVSGPSVPRMLNAITITQIYVPDQDQALDFYVGKLGFEVTTTPTSAPCAG